jgi:hypothetical protein
LGLPVEHIWVLSTVRLNIIHWRLSPEPPELAGFYVDSVLPGKLDRWDIKYTKSLYYWFKFDRFLVPESFVPLQGQLSAGHEFPCCYPRVPKPNLVWHLHMIGPGGVLCTKTHFCTTVQYGSQIIIALLIKYVSYQLVYMFLTG